jgi:hypothetical protein
MAVSASTQNDAHLAVSASAKKDALGINNPPLPDGYMVYGTWYIYGIWHMAYGIWHMAYGI